MRLLYISTKCIKIKFLIAILVKCGVHIFLAAGGVINRYIQLVVFACFQRAVNSDRGVCNSVGAADCAVAGGGDRTGAGYAAVNPTPGFRFFRHRGIAHACCRVNVAERFNRAAACKINSAVLRYYAANGRVSCQRSRRFVIGIALKCKVKHAAVARIKVSVIVAVYRIADINAVYRTADINIVSSCNIIGKFGTCRTDYTALGIGSYNIIKVGAVCRCNGNISIVNIRTCSFYT